MDTSFCLGIKRAQHVALVPYLGPKVVQSLRI